MPGKLSAYHAKRDFKITSEPKGRVAARAERLRFVVQKHAARRLHYDFRLEFDGTLKSWAVPKGPSLDPHEKRLAVHVEDHPLDYIDFEGDIPPHQYGAGHVDVWDTGTWVPEGDPSAAYLAGKLKFHLDGEKLHGGWTLVRTRLQGSGDKEQWLLIKESDEVARPSKEFDITEAMPDSVLSSPPAKKNGKTGASKTARTAKKNATVATRAKSAEAVEKQPARKSAKTAAHETEFSDPATLSGAKKAPLPDMIAPQLATLVDAIPQSGDWLYEIKYDGYRILAKIDKGVVRMYTRAGNDWTAKLPKQVAAIKELSLDSAWLDGEIVVDDHGVPSFQLLQKAFDENSTADILFFIFDVPYFNGIDLRQSPLSQRHSLLESILNDTDGPLRYSAPLNQPPEKLLDSACELAMEGIIGKRSESRYVSGRTADWIKLKCRQRQEFIIAGYTEPQGSRKFFGALLLAVNGEDGKLHYSGRVGTGFNQSILHSTHKQLHALEQSACPFGKRPAGVSADTHWVRPQLVAEISFAEWTKEGLLRQAVFHGLRLDKTANEISREKSVSMSDSARKKANGSKPAQLDQQPAEHTDKQPTEKSAPRKTASEEKLQGIKISNPERVIDPSSGLTKLDLARYYEFVAPAMLPFLQNRPVYLMRCPEGIEGEKFFQKHSDKMSIPGIRTLDQALDPGHAPLMVIESAHALVGAAQMGTVELHTCNATADLIDRPDCMVFDLDPGPDLPWSKVVEGVRLTKVVLDELGLKSFLKTSGGKGLHLVVPLVRRHDWALVRDFSQAVAQHMTRIVPGRFSAKMGEKNRVGKIFVDYLRNQIRASTVAPYSVRARPGLPVAVPVAWEELDHLTGSAMWTIKSLPQRLEQLKVDPWKDYAGSGQTITVAMQKKIGVAGRR